MKKLLIASVIALSFVASAQAKENAFDRNNATKAEVQQKVDKIMEKQAEWQARINFELAPVKSESDLYKVLDKKSALDLLSEPAKQRFIESLVFTVNGLGGFKYDELEAELTPTQIYRVLSLFGAQQYTSSFGSARVETSADAMLISIQSGSASKGFLEGYFCQSKGTCQSADNFACTSRC